MYRVQSRVPMPHAWGVLNSPLQADAAPFVNFSADYLAFDVHPARKVYAYCSGNAIMTYDYEGLQLGSFIDFAYLPEPCSDIRFTSNGNYLMATSRTSSRLFRCDPQCASQSSAFVYSSVLKKRACSPARDAKWGDGVRVYCIAWFDGTFTASESNLLQQGRAFAGGVQNFLLSSSGRSTSSEALVYSAGGFRTVTEPSSWVWWIYADASPSRQTIQTFLAGEQIVGPLAYNDRIRR